MTDNKKILFIINGYGMGNATRCEALIEKFPEQFQIDVVTSDKAYEFFKRNKRIRSLHSQTDVKGPQTYAYGSFLFFISFLPRFFSRLVKNYKLQHKIINNTRYDFIFFDSDYSFIIHRLFGLKTMAGINNAFEVVQFYKTEPHRVKTYLFFSVLLEKIDFLIHRMFFKYVLCPSVSPEKLVPHVPPNVFVIPLLVRSEFQSPPDGNTKGILVTSSCSGEKSAIFKIAEDLRSPGNQVLAGTFEIDIISALLNADLVLCNSGQSSVAECLYLKKKAVLFPIPKHSEQLANAVLAEQRGLLIYSGQTAQQLLEDVKTHYSEHNISELNYRENSALIKSAVMKILKSDSGLP
jgi:UDP:flavonoid glycosyltransferase YjiC (YdhE family)